MALRTSRNYQIALWSLTILCVGGAGYIGYRTFFVAASPAQQLQAAEQAYRRGSEAYQGQKWNDAVVRFDEARILANKAIETVKAQAAAGKIAADEGQKMIGQLMWVKARAIRDHTYAKAQAETKPIAEIPDPQVGETYRSFDAIADADAHREALDALGEAADKLGSDPAVIKDALRWLLVQPTIDWAHAEGLLRKSIELNPKDSRAHFYLARLEFEQPVGPAATPTPGDRKAVDRVEKAREHLATLKQAGFVAWRTIGLEAAILDWNLEMLRTRKVKPNELAAAEKSLDQLLFEPEKGALALAARGEKLAGLGAADLIGIRNVVQIAMSRGLADVRKSGGTAERVRIVAEGTLSLVKKLTEDATLAPAQPDMLALLVEVAELAQRYFSRAEPNEWRDYMLAVDAILTRLPEAAKARPMLRLDAAAIAARDADTAIKSGNLQRAMELRHRAIQQAEEGLKAAEEGKLTSLQIDEFHLHIAEWRLLSGLRGEAIESHLKPLRVSLAPRLRLYGQFLDGMVAQHQGRLEKARKLLLPLASDRVNKDIAYKANVVLVHIAFASSDPDAALAALRELEPALQRQEELSPTERAWGAQFLDPNEVFGSEIIAILEIALQISKRYSRDNPGKPLPSDLVTSQETSVEALRKKLVSPSSGDRRARLAIASYLAQTARRAVAEVRLAELATDYPESIEVLRARAVLLATPPTAGDDNPNGVSAADAVIRKFLKDYPTDRAARLFYAEWLVSTDRAQKAVEYLNDPLTFPGGRDETVNRLLFNALTRLGQREEANRVLRSLTQDPDVDALLIQAAATREGGDQQLQGALGRYENQGVFRIYDSYVRLGEGKYEEALRGFASAVEYTQVSRFARAGIVQALIAFGEVDPNKGREAAIQMAGEFPDEPGIYLAAAQAALNLEEVGGPDDKWELVKTMYAAVNMWETVALKAGLSRQDISVGRTLFRLWSGDPDAAKREATTGLNRFTQNVPLMMILGDLYLMTPAEPERAREYYTAAVKENPTNPELPFLDARIKSAAGDWAGAIKVYEQVLSEKPQNATAYSLLIRALDATGQKEEALRRADAWQKILPEDKGAVHERIRLLSSTDKRAAANKVAADYLARSVAAVQDRLASEVPPAPKAEADKALALAREKALTLTMTAFYRGQAYAEAEAKAQEILHSNPTNSAALVTLGDIAVARKQWDHALATYQEILKQNPRHFGAGNNAACILLEQKNNPQAAFTLVEEIRKGLNGVRPIAPERLPAVFLDTMGSIYVKLNQPGRFVEMRSIFESAVKRYPADPRMYFYLAYAVSELGEKARALEILDRVVPLAGTKNGLSEVQNRTVVEKAESLRKRIRG
jgi:tetratricopeptide (TPR) repeat protein